MLVVEGVIPHGNDPSFSKLLDLAMLAIPGGKERTEEEFRRLYEPVASTYQNCADESRGQRDRGEEELGVTMDPKTVERLEAKLEEAIADVIVKMGLKRLPLLPSRHTIQMMAKAAAAVYEVAAEGDSPQKG